MKVFRLPIVLSNCALTPKSTAYTDRQTDTWTNCRLYSWLFTELLQNGCHLQTFVTQLNHQSIYSVSQKKKIPPCGFLTFFQNEWEFLNQFLHTYYTIVSALDYKFIFNYLQL